MKRSNLIILILVLLFPAGFLLHNLALRAAFYEVKAQPIGMWEGDRRYYRELPPFRHIVVEGGVRLLTGKKMHSGSYNIHAVVSVGPGNKPGLEYRLDVKPCLRTDVRNDTLFCWFEAENSRQWRYASRNYYELTIKAPEIASIQTDSTLLDILELKQQSPVFVQISNSYQVKLVDLYVPKLDLKGDKTFMNILSGTIDTLRYELGDQTNLTLSAGVANKKKELVKAHPHANFTMTGIPADSAQDRAEARNAQSH